MFYDLKEARQTENTPTYTFVFTEMLLKLRAIVCNMWIVIESFLCNTYNISYDGITKQSRLQSNSPIPGWLLW